MLLIDANCGANLRAAKWNKKTSNFMKILLIRTFTLIAIIAHSSSSIIPILVQANDKLDQQQQQQIEHRADEPQIHKLFLQQPQQSNAIHSSSNNNNSNNNNTSARNSQQNAWSDRNGSESRQSMVQIINNNGPSIEQQFVAGGASSLQPTTATIAIGNNNNQQQQQQQQQQHRGRLVDRIASPSQKITSSLNIQQQQQQTSEKLDYIIEFMRQNKLSKFCDLLTNQQSDLIKREVVKRLNSMQQFTLFVPTNEALLLQSGQFFEQLRAKPEEATRFLLAHATSDLIIPKILHNISNTNGQFVAGNQFQDSLVYSLANSPLRISTLMQNGPMNSRFSANPLELIVNGANVIPGHSYALQEPNNANATHAIVHLIDRSLYPIPSDNLLDLMRQFAPTMAQLIDLAAQNQLEMRKFKQQLDSPTILTTFFAPNEEAFKATPAKLLAQLYTNNTFLQSFLKNHQLASKDKLYFNGQLAAIASNNEQINANLNADANSNANGNFLTSIGNDKLEFEAKSLQNRQLVVVNSIPIASSDLMATNGVLHLISRPLFSPNLLDDCQCTSPVQSLNSRNLQSSQNNMSERDQIDDGPIGTIVMGSGRGQQPQIRASDQFIERETTTTLNQQQQANRAQRSNNGKLPIGSDRNRVDFYRPSIEPANLRLVQPIGNLGEQLGFVESRSPSVVAQNPIQVQQQQQQQQQQLPIENSSKTLQPLSVVPNYEVTLNATSRQRLRAEQLKLPPNQQQAAMFAYDEPLLVINPKQQQTIGKNQSIASNGNANVNGTVATASDRLKRPYLAGLVELTPVEQQQHDTPLLVPRDFLSRGESAKREQRLLKFQPEDGRDASQIQQQTSGKSINTNNNNNSSNLTASTMMTINNQLQPAYDYVTSPVVVGSSKLQSTLQQQQQAPNSLSCAFYDSDCRRLMGRLVRLPANTSNNNVKQMAFNGLRSNMPNVTAAYDVSFNDSMAPTIQMMSSAAKSRQQQQQQQQQLASSRYVQAAPSTRQHSVLNQPLPPLSLDETANLRQLASGHQWKIQDADINRIVAPPGGKSETHAANPSARLIDLNNNNNNNNNNYAHGFTSGISRQQQATSSNVIANNNNNNATSMIFDLPRGSPNAPLRQAQILFVPVKLVNNDTTSQRTNRNNSNTEMTMNLPGNVLILSKSQQQQAQSYPSSTSAPPQFNNQQQYLTPIQPMTQLVNSSPIMHHNHNYDHQNNIPTNYVSNTNHMTATRSNLTLADDSVEGFDVPMGADLYNNNNNNINDQNSTLFMANQPISSNNKHQQSSSSRLKQAQYNSAGATQANLPLTPTLIHRKQQQQHQNYDHLSNGSGGVKWPIGSAQSQQQIPFSDFSVTSARLTDATLNSRQQQLINRHNSNATVALATQASDPQQQQLSVSLQQQQQQTTGNNPTSADYFQDRTIAEIMDDSGLRIDGQLVTFKRLKQCLSDANLLSLASQTGQSLTIFMPTDQAFQRLVQLAFGQRQSQSTTQLSSHQQQQQLPLVIRAPPNNDDAITSDSSSTSSLGALDRLTLDCQAPLIRQMLLDHISAKLITPKQLASDSSIASLSGRQLILSSVPSKQIVVVDGQPVLAATRAKNGMVYVINKFLNLTQQMANVVDLMQTQPELSTFMGYLRQANNNNLSDRLKREAGPLTILAPTNDAFDQLSPSARQLISSDPSALMDILRGHVIDGAQFGKLISMRTKLHTMNKDQRIEAKVIKPNVYMLDNQMTSMRLVGTAANGVVNAIDRLIVPSWLRNSMSAPGLTATSARVSPITNNSPGLDTSASANSAAATLARQRLHSVEPGLRLQPDLVHGNADNIFRSNQNNHHNHRSVNSDQNSLARLNGENFLQFNSANRLNGSSSSSSSSLAGSSDLFKENNPNNGLNLQRFNSLPVSNELETTNSNSNNRDNNITSAAINSKNMQLIEKLANLMQAKKFLKFLLNSKAHELLKPDMNYVILVPTDQAIERLPSQILNLLERDSDRLSDLVNYHIIDTTFDYINTIPDGQTLQTLNEKDILFNWHRNNTILTVSGAIVLGGIQEENIALLIVDRVLYPTPGDLLAIVNKSPILSNFTTIIKNAGLDNQLTRAGPYTLFAPSDQAFSQLEKSDLEFLQRNKEIARRFLLRHLSSPMVFTSSIALSSNMTSRSNNNNQIMMQQLTPSINITNSLGEDLILRQRNDYFSVNDINFSYADVAASNGVLHVIDGLL